MRLLLTIGASRLPRLDTVAFDGRVLLFALVALSVSGVLVGFAPALRLAGTDVRTLMNESGRSSTGGRGTTRWLGASGVVAAGSTFNFPLRGGPENALLVHLQNDPDAAHNLNSRQRIVSPGFFAAMGIKLVGGRDFTVDDNVKSPPRSWARR